MIKLILVIAIFIGALFFKGNAQEKWSLQKCIEYAQTNNINIKQATIGTQYQQNLLQQAKDNRLPNLNAGISQGFNYGRSLTLDNTYKDFSSAQTGLSINTSVPIFEGFTIKNAIKKSEFDLQASFEDLQKAKDDLSLNVASAYLDILFSNEIVKVAEQQIAQTKKQILQSKKLVEAGKIARGSLLEIEAQLAREELDLVNRSNSLQLSYLRLAQMLELTDKIAFEIDVPVLPELKAEASVLGAATVYENAVANRPEIRSATYKLKSSESQMKIAEGNRLPSLSFNAGYNNQYFNSSQANEPSFGDQFSNNDRESFGLNLNIPIFNRFQAKHAISNAKLQVENKELDLESAKKELRSQIETAYTNAVAALKRYGANQKAVLSMEEAFRYVEEKFNVGLVSTVEFNDAKTKLASAQSNLIQARYDFIFRTKILDFYNGIPIQL